MEYHGQDSLESGQIEHGRSGAYEGILGHVQCAGVYAQLLRLTNQLVEGSAVDHQDVQQIVYIGHSHDNHGFYSAMSHSGSEAFVEGELLCHDLCYDIPKRPAVKARARQYRT